MTNERVKGKWLLRLSALASFMGFGILFSVFISAALGIEGWFHLISAYYGESCMAIYILIFFICFVGPSLAIIGGKRYLSDVEIGDRRDIANLSAITLAINSILVGLPLTAFFITGTEPYLIPIFLGLAIDPIVQGRALEKIFGLGGHPTYNHRNNLMVILVLIMVLSIPFIFMYYDIESLIIALPMAVLVLMAFIEASLLKDQWTRAGLSPVKEEEEASRKGTRTKIERAELLRTYSKAGVMLSAIFLVMTFIIFSTGFGGHFRYHIFELLVGLAIPPGVFMVALVLDVLKNTRKKGAIEGRHDEKIADPQKNDQEEIDRPPGFIQTLRERITDTNSYSKWMALGASSCLALISLLGLSLHSQFIEGPYPYSIRGDLLLQPLWFIVTLIMLPVSVIHMYFRREKGPDRIWEFFPLLGTAIILTLMVYNIFGPLTMDDWGEYIIFDESGVWPVFLLIPMFTALVYPVESRFFTTKRMFFLAASSLMALISCMITYSLYNYTGDSGPSQLIRDLSILVFLCPLASLLMVSSTLTTVTSVKKKLHGTLKKAILPFVSVPLIVLILSLSGILAGITSEYTSWHSYELDLDYPEGDDLQYCIDVLSMNLSDIVHEEPFENDYLKEPNILNWSDLKRMERWLKDAKRDGVWGEHYLDISLTLERNKTMIIAQEYEADSYGTYRTLITHLDGDTLWVGSHFDYYGRMILYFNHNGTDYLRNFTGFHGIWEDRNLTYDLGTIDLIHVDVHIGTQTAPLAGYGGDLDQYVGVKNDRIVFIYSERDNWIS